MMIICFYILLSVRKNINFEREEKCERFDTKNESKDTKFSFITKPLKNDEISLVYFFCSYSMILYFITFFFYFLPFSILVGDRIHSENPFMLSASEIMMEERISKINF